MKVFSSLLSTCYQATLVAPEISSSRSERVLLKVPHLMRYNLENCLQVGAIAYKYITN